LIDLNSNDEGEKAKSCERASGKKPYQSLVVLVNKQVSEAVAKSSGDL